MLSVIFVIDHPDFGLVAVIVIEPVGPYTQVLFPGVQKSQKSTTSLLWLLQ
jgi:hypothetical protein